MKKIFLTLIIALALTGCAEKDNNEKLDLSKIEQTLSGIAYSVDDQNKKVDLIFDNNMTVTSDYLVNVYNIDVENIESYIFSMPVSKESAEMYAIVLPKKGKSASVKENLDTFIKQYQKEYKGTNFEAMTDNALSQSYGDYLIYIISNKSETVYNTITGK